MEGRLRPKRVRTAGFAGGADAGFHFKLGDRLRLTTIEDFEVFFAEAFDRVALWRHGPRRVRLPNSWLLLMGLGRLAERGEDCF